MLNHSVKYLKKRSLKAIVSFLQLPVKEIHNKFK